MMNSHSTYLPYQCQVFMDSFLGSLFHSMTHFCIYPCTFWIILTVIMIINPDIWYSKSQPWSCSSGVSWLFLAFRTSIFIFKSSCQIKNKNKIKTLLGFWSELHRISAQFEENCYHYDSKSSKQKSGYLPIYFSLL